MPAHLLVVEDDDLQQAVLKSALEKRGYSVDVASDGLSAIRMLRAGGYDLALIDYRLPEIDGFASARVLRELMAEEDRPRLIAVTAASDSLTLRDASSVVFDAIVPKSLELPSLIAIVETHLRETPAGRPANAAEATWREFGLNGMPAVIVLPLPTPAQVHLLRHYFDLSNSREPEAILLLGPEAEGDAMGLRLHSACFTLPIIDLTGCLVGADAVFSAKDRLTWGAAASAITRFAKGRRQLGRDAVEASGLDARLLAYVFLSARPFQPSKDVASRECIRYPGFFPCTLTRLAAERLADRGLLDRQFFERFHVCGGCGSFRLNVREECPSCHSANLREMRLIHHFRCAHQAPEIDFVRGATLVCPKCHRQLSHFGRDYHESGTVAVCGDCEAVSADPQIVFACLDCDARTAGDAAVKQDIYSYTLTRKGTELLRRGAARFADDGLHDVTTLPEAIAAELARKAPVAALFELCYGARARITARRGEAGFTAMRSLFLKTLVGAVGGDCVAASGPEADYLLIRSARPGPLMQEIADFLDACQALLPEDLEPELRRLKLAPTVDVSAETTVPG